MVSCRLHIQICTYGQEGLDRVASHSHPAVDGVRWLVSVQCESEVTIPKEIASRSDFDVVVHHDKGLSINRNHALDFPCDSEYVLISDDDLDYDETAVKQLLKAFESHPHVDVFCMRYTNEGKYVKEYGNGDEFDLRKPPFGWYVASVEIAFRRKAVGNIRFNTHMGTGSEMLIAGEEGVWLYDVLKAGAKGIFVPIDICQHNAPTTAERSNVDAKFLMAQGAAFYHIKPVTWLPRLILYAFRTPCPFFRSLKHTLAGVRYARKHKIFKNLKP